MVLIYSTFEDLETGKKYQGLEILELFYTHDIIEWVNSSTMDEYHTYDDWLSEFTDEQIIDEMNIREINPFAYTEFQSMLAELVAEVPKEIQTMHFKVVLDRLERFDA